MPYNTNHALLSSPDPLNDSPTFSSPAKPHTSKIRRSLPLNGSSPRKQTFQLDVGDQLSPQKIRVTVEAEHSDDNVYHGRKASGGRNLPSPSPYRAPTIRQSVRTTTTTVPVKGLSDSEDDSFDSASERPTRGRGRPRKSVGTPVPAKSRNRAVTPAAKPSPGRRRTLGHLVDGDDPEDWDFAIGTGVEVSRGKGRSRSRSVKGVARNKSTPAAKLITSPDKTISSTTSKKGRGRRKTLTPGEIRIHEDDIDLTTNICVNSDDERLDAKRVLAQRDTNLVPIRSADVTNRFSSIMGNEVINARDEKFSSAGKTFPKAGCSTSRQEPVKTESSAGSLVDGAAGITKLRVESPLQPVASGETRNFDGHQNDQDDENDDEIREFDTILESEGFSMISVESVPSLREHLSSPFGPNENGLKSETRNTSRAIPDSKNDIDAHHEDSFSSIAPEILEAATPRKKASNPLLRAVLSANIPGDGDSFSSIPPEILNAATPRKQRPNNEFLSTEVWGCKFNDDSFSSIPPAILEAASPTKHVQTEVTKPNFQSESRKDSKPITKLAIVSSFQSLDTERKSLTSSGLLTPNETPSPTETATQQTEASAHSDNKISFEPEHGDPPFPEGSSIINSQIRSSPPSASSRRFMYTAHSHQPKPLYANHMETPSIVFSSPSLPPLIQPLLLDRSKKTSQADPNQPPRPSLSPIVRAGRILQEIAMTSTSRSRTQSLGSPFKSPAAQRISVGAPAELFGTSNVGEKSLQKSPEKSKGESGDLFKGFSDDTMKELRKSMIIGEEFARNQKGSTTAGMALEEDPFHSGIQSERSPSPQGRKEYTLELPSHKRTLHTGLMREEQGYQDSVRSESAMSWQPESALHVPTSCAGGGKIRDSHIIETTTLFEQRREAEWANERAAVRSQIESASPSKVIVIESDDEQDAMNASDEIDNAEEDIWQVEAQHSSSILEEQSSHARPRQEPLEKPRRSKIPSPWRKNSKRLVYSDELTQLSSPQQPEKYDRLSSDVQIKPRGKPAQITARKQVSTHDVAQDEDGLPDSSIMWHIPQKSNFAPRPRNSGNLDLSALLASSPFKRPQPSSQIHPKIETPDSRSSRGNVLNSADVELAVLSSNSPIETGLHGSKEESYSTEKIAPNGSIVESTRTSYEESERVSEPSSTDSRVLYPNLPSTTSPSPQKSCLRTPTSTSPTKSVAFISPTQSPPPLSATTWSKAHWKFLHAIYDESKSLPHSPSIADAARNGDQDHEGEEDAAEPSKYLGKTIRAQGAKLTLEQWHLDIVREFREEVLGWDEGDIAKRLFAIIIGEERRRQGRNN